MNSIADSIFRLMLGWMKSMVHSIWQLFGNQPGGGVGWLTANWKSLAVIICVLCAVVDLVVYLIRWRSLRVWGSFFRRLRGEGVEADEAEWGDESAPVLYTTDDGAFPPETEYLTPVAEDMDSQMVEYDDVSYPDISTIRYAEVPDKNAPVQGLEDYPQEEKRVRRTLFSKPVRRERNTETVSARKSVHGEIRRFFGEEEEENAIRYNPAQPTVNKQDAYHRPYIPPEWRPPETGKKTNS